MPNIMGRGPFQNRVEILRRGREKFHRERRPVESATDRGGADVLICPEERSSAILVMQKNLSSFARLADEDICD
jgi:hypothetical protein